VVTQRGRRVGRELGRPDTDMRGASTHANRGRMTDTEVKAVSDHKTTKWTCAEYMHTLRANSR